MAIKPPKSIDDCLTKQEAAERLKVSERTIDRMRERGDLQGWQLAAVGGRRGQVWFSKIDIERIASNMVAAK